MAAMLKAVAENPRFQWFITAVIILAGVLVGIETSKDAMHAFGHWLHLADKVILFIFVVEIVVKMGAEGRRPWRYFYDPWNVFDFSIVAAAFLPFAGSGVTVLRLVRLLRVLRLVSTIPRLQVLVGALLHAVPSMGYVSMLLGLQFYVYGVAGVFLFGENDPLHFGTLPAALLTLFQVVTLEGWADLMAINMYGCDHVGYEGMEAMCTQPQATPTAAVIYFITFVVSGTMVALNLFIGVILDGMSEAQKDQLRDAIEHPEGGDPRDALVGEIEALTQELDHLQSRLANLRGMASKAPPRDGP